MPSPLLHQGKMGVNKGVRLPAADAPLVAALPWGCWGLLAGMALASAKHLPGVPGTGVGGAELHRAGLALTGQI